MKTIERPENRIWNAECECMEQGKKEALQWERLQRVVRTAWEKLPYYRKKMEEAGVGPDSLKGLKDLKKLPLTTKNDLRGCFPYKGFAVPMREIVRIHASSGTTGQATVVGYTKRDLDTWSELMARTHTAAGITADDLVQICFGYGFFTGGLGHHYGLEKLGAAVLPVSSGKSERQLQIMRDYGTSVLIGTPSYAMHLAELAEKTGIKKDIHLRLGVFGSEAWSERMRTALEEAWGVFCTDNYGLSEVMGPGVSCECVERNGMHFAEDHFIAELIDPETGEEATDPYGKGGELVLTSLTKEAIPVIRYRTRDLCHFIEGACPCGRTGKRMSRVSARSDDMLIIRGVNVFPQQVEEALLSVPGVTSHYQIVVSREGTMDDMEVQVEVGAGVFFDQMRQQQEMKARIETVLQNNILVHAKVRLVEPNTLPRSEGKAVRVVDLRKSAK